MVVKSRASYTGCVIFMLLMTLVLTNVYAAEAPSPDTLKPASELAGADSAAQFRSNLFELVDSVPLIGSMLSIVWFSVTDFKGWSGFVPILVKTLIILASGWLGFLLLRPTSLRRKFNERAANHKEGGTIALYSLISVALELLSIAIFYFVASAVLNYMIDAIKPTHALVANLIWAVTAILIFNAVMRAILSPNNANLRMMPIEDKPVKLGFKVLLVIFAVLQLGLAALSFLEHMGLAPVLLHSPSPSTLRLSHSFGRLVSISTLYSIRQDHQIPHSNPHPQQSIAYGQLP